MKSQKENHSVKKIYVALLGEGTDVWRPVDALSKGKDIFEIISRNESNGDEIWEFECGDQVRCVQKVLSNGEISLIAISRVQR